MRFRISTYVFVCGLGLALASPLGVRAAPEPALLVLRDHRFTPTTLTVPAGQKVQIVLMNQDRAIEEFDSQDLNVEELVTPNGRVTFSIGPLKPGTYAFMGEYHSETAQGRVIAVEAQP